MGNAERATGPSGDGDCDERNSGVVEMTNFLEEQRGAFKFTGSASPVAAAAAAAPPAAERPAA